MKMTIMKFHVKYYQVILFGFCVFVSHRGMSNLVLIGKLKQAWYYANSGLENAFVYEVLRLNNKTKCSPDIYISLYLVLIECP